ncbi:MAG: InlB B-repeat-containing protein, partial [Clostridia bacterium]|nr:InlB B-repeat-containing protein [Clostridia bacterium]
MSKKFNRFLALLILLPCMFIMVGCKKNKNNNNNNNNPPQSYSISYELNGGVNNSDNPTSYTSLSETITFKSPTKENYDFIGWYLDEDFTIEISKIEKGSTGNKTLYARFNPTIFTIEYILNGGEIAENSKVEYTIISDTITLLEPTKNGYDFGGWYTDENFTIRETEIVKGSSGNKKFFARWIPVVYSITYELNGGINNTNNKSDYTIETPTFNFSNPTKLGYDFDGWYLENNFTTKVTEIKVGTIGNKTFYAKWKATIYSVNYELSGGNNNSNNPEYYTIESNTISLLEPTKTGYYFDGWYLDSDFVTPVTKIEKGTTGPKKFYASFKPETYKITFDYADADGNNEVTDIDVIFDMKVGELPIPTKTNYDFLGWWYNSTLFEDETVYKVAGNITLTASWKEKDAVIETFDVVFDTNGGSAIESQEDVVFGSKISKPIDPTKLGYKFVAWLYNGNEWDFDVQSVTKNITLVAEWELINYTIIYHLYDGHNDSTNPETYTILSENITLKKAFKDGYSFRGWFTDDKFTNKIEVIETGSTGEINLYAQFAEIETGAYAKVSFKYNLPSCVSNLYKDFERDIQKYSFFTLPSFDGSNLKDYLIGFFYIDSENNEIQITQNVYEILSTKDIEIFAKWNNEDIEKYYFTDLLEIILSEDNSYAIVKSYTGIANKIVIPRLYKVNGVDYKVLEISSDCFNNNTNIEEVVINSEELVIGDNAFNKCKITSFDFNKVKSIGKYAFANTSLVEVNLSSILTKIDKGAVSGSKLTKVTFIGTPQNLTSIPEKCFENCENLNQITFNSNINEIGNQAFYGCNSLENLEFLKNLSDNSTLHDNVFENCNSLTSVTLNYNIQLIGNTIFKGCENLTELKIYRFYY